MTLLHDHVTWSALENVLVLQRYRVGNKIGYLRLPFPNDTSQVSIIKRLCFKIKFSVLFSHLLV